MSAVSGVVVRDEVAAALADGRPVVALESTIISHGMPHPQNVETALAVEDIVREHGAVPATVAVLDGVPRAGLTRSEIELLGSASSVVKLSTRDLGYAVARGLHGATTVAATMRVAALAGIPVFATGGIGGVHRGADRSFDVSADLTELARTPVAVVSAGVKSILDVGLTLERLETLGVPVLVHGSDEFPSFYSRSSGHPAPARVDSPAAAAAIMRATWEFGGTGLLVANPIPAAEEIPAAQIDGIIDRALADAAAEAVVGKEITPFLLDRIAAITGGSSLTANIALIRNNARFAAEVAAAYADARRGAR